MSPDRKNSTSVIVGLLSAMIILMLMESFSAKLFPMPEGINLKDPKAMIEAMNNMPMSAKLFQLFNYLLAAFVGGLVSTKISEGVTKYPQLIVAGIFAFLTLVNTLAIGEQAWFSITSVLIPFPSAYLGYLLMKKK